MSSWGGNVVHDPSTGQYHLFAAAMTQGCNLNTWTSNSLVIHAVANSATGTGTGTGTIIVVKCKGIKLVGAVKVGILN